MPENKNTGTGAPLVSVVMACYNAEKFVRATLDSILAQTWPNLEVCVADDASTDSSREILASYGGVVRWETGPRRGQSAAVNRAYRMAAGRFINFHDGDDLMAPDKIARQVEVALANPGMVVYGPWRLAWHNGSGFEKREERQTGPVPDDADLLEMHLRGWFCPNHAYLWPRSVIERIGLWDESLCADKDADYAMRAILAGVGFVYCPNAWADYVMHKGPRESVSRTARSLRSRCRVVRKVTRVLEEQRRLDRYRDAIAWRYDEFARTHWETCRPVAVWCARQARRISGKPTEVGKWHYRLVRRMFGIYVAEGIAMAKRRLLRLF